MSAPRSNLAKYETKNPVVRNLIGRYFGTLEGIVRPLKPASILDVGCGEGITASRLSGLGLQFDYQGLDFDAGAIVHAKQRNPGLKFETGDVYDLGDRQADVVICLEVLEHLEDPARALASLAKAARKHVIVSVPWEPWFRLGNLMRGKYLSQLGNHPEHIQQLAPSKLEALLRTQFDDVHIETSFPWVFGWAPVRGAA
jgi:2-polyprenyl-3-methyl-5-hydroxy-6-metoxy-1,4-benzoquinol methylase